MALNLNKTSNTFRRKAEIVVFSDKGVPVKNFVNCEFKRTSKEDADAFDAELAAADDSSSKAAMIRDRLEEVWMGWDVVDDNGPLQFTHENRDRLFNLLAGSMYDIYRAYVGGVLGIDRKNA